MTRTIIIRRDYLHYIPKYRALQQYIFYHTWLTTFCLLLDRYEKRHKNLAAHVSPAFRVELGDVVTVGMSIFLGLRVLSLSSLSRCRPVSTVIENRSIQRYPCSEEQGVSKDIRQVLAGRLVSFSCLCRHDKGSERVCSFMVRGPRNEDRGWNVCSQPCLTVYAYDSVSKLQL